MPDAQKHKRSAPAPPATPAKPAGGGAASDAASAAAGTYTMVTSARVIRGGNFNYGVSDLLPSGRFTLGPANRDSIMGFRCSRTP